MQITFNIHSFMYLLNLYSDSENEQTARGLKLVEHPVP